MKAVCEQYTLAQGIRLDVVNVNLIIVAATVLVELETHSTFLLATKVVLVDLPGNTLEDNFESKDISKMKSSPLPIQAVPRMPSSFWPHRRCT